jgi:hypothetical protein
MSRKINILKLQKEAEAARDEWLAKADVPGRVSQMLDNKLKDVVGKLLGFDVRWGSEWRVDHCNGRAGNSAAGDYLREKCGASVNEWLDKAAGDLPPLPKTAIRSIVSSYHEMLESAIRDQLYKKAQSEAEKIANSILRDVTSTPAADNVEQIESKEVVR